MKHLCPILLTLLLGCQPPPAPSEQHAHQTGPSDRNRIAIPGHVRDNLGLTFATAEVRPLARTIRIPGSFERTPAARREYRAMLDGRITLHVAQFDTVQQGVLLYTLESPSWRSLQQQLNESRLKQNQVAANLAAMDPLLQAHEQHHIELEQAVEIWTQRAAQLEANRGSGVVSDEDVAQSRGRLATARSNLAEVLEREAELQLRRVQGEVERDAEAQRFALLLRQARAVLGIPADQELAWETIDAIEVRANAEGVVESIPSSNGEWVAPGDLVVTSIDPRQVRFRAYGLQADLTELQQTSQAQLLPPGGKGQALPATLQFGLDAHPDERTLALLGTPTIHQPWMRAGVSSFLEVVVDRSAPQALSIPRSAIIKDGIEHVFFRRNPSKPDEALRVAADMGLEEGGWVEIRSGLMRGDQVVLEGAYELKLASQQKQGPQRGGHVHADGSFHGDH